jgi:molybdopterin-containing oxidoreductase family iron-sulfur binding subunit
MSLDRRDFLRILGIAGFAGVGVNPLWEAIAGREGIELVPPGGAVSTKKWGMVIDPRKCLKLDGCRICIDACHKAHNVPDIKEPRHEVKWIWKEHFENAFPDLENKYMDSSLAEKPVLVFCNHCDNPPCVKVCPTKATWKRDDGIVMMDWHRCIGCRYCMAACPYGSRSFNWSDPRPHIAEITKDFPTRSKGVVEKCTFCAERLVDGKIPLCVEACPEKALIFGDLNHEHSEIRELLRLHYSIRRKTILGTEPEIYYLV